MTTLAGVMVLALVTQAPEAPATEPKAADAKAG